MFAFKKSAESEVEKEKNCDSPTHCTQITASADAELRVSSEWRVASESNLFYLLILSHHLHGLFARLSSKVSETA